MRKDISYMKAAGCVSFFFTRTVHTIARGRNMIGIEEDYSTNYIS